VEFISSLEPQNNSPNNDIIFLQTITKSKLIPFSREDVPERVTNFKRLNDQVKRHFSDILVVVMSILQQQYQEARNSDSHAHSPRLEDSSSVKVFDYFLLNALPQVRFIYRIIFSIKG